MSKLFVDVHAQIKVVDVFVPNKMRLHDLRNFEKAREVTISDILDPESAATRVLLVGEAGMGKTTLLKYITQIWCNVYDSDLLTHDSPLGTDSEIKALLNYRYLFFISIAVVDKEKFIMNMIYERLAKDFNRDIINDILREDKCLILIDGVDGMKTGQQRSRCFKSLDFFQKNCTIIISVRPKTLREWCPTQREVDITVELEGIKREFVPKFIDRNVCELDKITKQTELSKTVVDKPWNFGDMDDFKNPLILKLAVVTWHLNGQVPSSMGNLFVHVICILLSKIKIDDYSSLQHPNDESFPCPIKHWKYLFPFKRQLINFGRFMFDTLLDKSYGEVVLDKTSMMSALNEYEINVFIQTGVLDRHISRICEFSLLCDSFRLFLAAIYLSSLDNTDREKRVRAMCESGEDVEEFTGVFQFLCALRPDNVVATVELLESLDQDHIATGSVHCTAFKCLREVVIQGGCTLQENKGQRKFPMTTVLLEREADKSCLKYIDLNTVRVLCATCHEQNDFSIDSGLLFKILGSCPQLRTFILRNTHLSRSDILSLVCDCSLTNVTFRNVECRPKNDIEMIDDSLDQTGMEMTARVCQIRDSPDILAYITNAPELEELTIEGPISRQDVFYVMRSLVCLELVNTELTHTQMTWVLCEINCLRSVSLTNVKCEEDSKCGCQDHKGLETGGAMKLTEFCVINSSESVLRHITSAINCQELKFIRKRNTAFLDDQLLVGFPFSQINDLRLGLNALTYLVLCNIHLTHLEMTHILCNIKNLKSFSVTDVIFVDDTFCEEGYSQRNDSLIKKIEVVQLMGGSDKGGNGGARKSNSQGLFPGIEKFSALDTITVDGLSDQSGLRELLNKSCIPRSVKLSSMKLYLKDLLMEMKQKCRYKYSSTEIVLTDIKPLDLIFVDQQWLTAENISINEWQVDMTYDQRTVHTNTRLTLSSPHVSIRSSRPFATRVI